MQMLKETMKNAPSEDSEQITFLNQLRKQKPHLAKVAVHIKNEGKRTMEQIQKDKAMGLVTGASDILIPGAPTLLIELKKRTSRAKPTDEQLEYIEDAEALGAMGFVCWGWEQGMIAVEIWENARR